MALAACKRLAKEDSAVVVKAAFEKVRRGMGGRLGKDGKINFSGAESAAGKMLCETLIARTGEHSGPSLIYMAEHWEEVCREADKDGSGTISEEEAVTIWDDALMGITSYVATKLEQLGAPRRLYRGDLCIVTPTREFIDPSQPKKVGEATRVVLAPAKWCVWSGACETARGGAFIHGVKWCEEEGTHRATGSETPAACATLRPRDAASTLLPPVGALSLSCSQEYLACYLDATHAAFFDDVSDEAIGIVKARLLALLAPNPTDSSGLHVTSFTQSHSRAPCPPHTPNRRRGRRARCSAKWRLPSTPRRRRSAHTSLGGDPQT